MQNKTPYQLPKICCHCGEKQGVAMRQINDSSVTGFGYYGIAVSVKRLNYSFFVPVCDECSEELAASDRKIKMIRTVISLLITGCFMYAFIFAGYIVSGLILSVAIFVILYLVLIIRPISGRNLGSFSGGHFWFSNREFFRQFAELNPQLVAPYYVQQLSSQLSGSAAVNPVPGFVWTKSNKILLFVVFISILCFLILCVVPILKSFIS
jgi:hypothetical protein